MTVQLSEYLPLGAHPGEYWSWRRICALGAVGPLGIRAPNQGRLTANFIPAACISGGSFGFDTSRFDHTPPALCLRHLKRAKLLRSRREYVQCSIRNHRLERLSLHTLDD